MPDSGQNNISAPWYQHYTLFYIILHTDSFALMFTSFSRPIPMPLSIVLTYFSHTYGQECKGIPNPLRIQLDFYLVSASGPCQMTQGQVKDSKAWQTNYEIICLRDVELLTLLTKAHFCRPHIGLCSISHVYIVARLCLFQKVQAKAAGMQKKASKACV